MFLGANGKAECEENRNPRVWNIRPQLIQFISISRTSSLILISFHEFLFEIFSHVYRLKINNLL